MSHIDEGLLHAYLDGETGEAERSDLERHLDGCAECRTRLEEARALRDRSGAILAGSGPAAVSAPPFEQVVARSRAIETRRRILGLNRLTALGWAATIVLALGVGWIARGTLGLSQRPASEVGFALDTAAPIVAEPVAEPEAEAAERRLAQVPARESQAVTGRGQRHDEPAPPAALKSEVAPAEGAPADVRAKIEETRAKLAEADVEQQPAAGVATPAAPITAARGRVGRVRMDTVEPGVLLRARGQAADEASDLDAIFGDVGEGKPWRVADAATAAERLGAAVMTLPDARVIVHLVPADAERVAVRVVQQLESGDVVALTQERAAAVSESEEAVAARDELRAMSEPVATARRGEFLLTLRGALPPDSLRALLETLP